MQGSGNANRPSCPRCGEQRVIANGRANGRQRWLCRACGRTFGATTGTALVGLKTEVTEVARTLLIVLRRGSLRAAEEQTGHKYETIGRWLRRAATHAEALTAVLVHDLRLSAVEVDEFWSFVHKKGRLPKRATPRGIGRPASAGVA